MEKQDKNSNVSKDDSKIQMFGRIEKIPMSERIRKALYLKECDKNSNV